MRFLIIFACFTASTLSGIHHLTQYSSAYFKKKSTVSKRTMASNAITPSAHIASAQVSPTSSAESSPELRGTVQPGMYLDRGLPRRRQLRGGHPGCCCAIFYAYLTCIDPRALCPSWR